MASDNLNQVGKFIGKTGRDADRSLKRTVPIRPRLERIRDVFDSTTEFEMSFEKTPNDSRVLLDLFFNLPPPIRGCKAGCVITKCEDFNLTSGNHAVTVLHPYLPGTVSVFIDGERLNNSQVFESNPAGGEVYFQGPASYSAVSICYIYLSDDCSTENNNLCLFDIKPSFAGAELAFCDRFDKAPSTQTFCGLGKWYSTFLSIDTAPPVKLVPTGGRVILPNTAYAFENLQGAGIISEVVFVADFTGWTNTSSSTFSINLFGANISISGTTHTMQIGKAYKYTPSSSPGSTWGVTTQFQTLPVPIPTNEMNKIMAGRFFVAPNVVAFKLWPLGTDEPDTWVLHTVPPNYNTATGGPIFPDVIATYTSSDVIGGGIGGSGITKGGLLSIQHWVGRTTAYGIWSLERQEQLPGYSWQYMTPAPQSSYDYVAKYSNNVYFEFGNHGTVPSLIEFQGANGNLSGNLRPDNAYHYVTGFFNTINGTDIDQINIANGTINTAVSFDTTIGKPTTYKIKGQVRWAQSSASRGIIPHLTVELEAMGYGGQTPNVGGDWIYGDIKQTLFLPFSAADSDELPGASGPYSGWRSRSAWTDFEIEVPSSGNHVQWGVRFLDTSLEVQDYLAEVAVDSILRDTTISIQFRGIWVEALMNPITTFKDICDAGSLAGRCTQIFESFAVPYSGLTECTTAYSTPYQGSAIPSWTMDLSNRGIVIPTINNNKLRVDFRARGQTLDGEDGRCPWSDGPVNWNNALGTSRTTATFSIYTNDSPAVCGWFDYSAKFKFRQPSNWTRPDGVQFNPTMTLIFGAFSGSAPVSPYVTLYKLNTIPSLAKRLGTTNNISDSIVFPFEDDVEYQLYAQFRDQLYIKIWPTGTIEPSAWSFIGPRTTSGVGSGIGLNISIIDFSDDNSYVEFSNVQVVSVEQIV